MSWDKTITLLERFLHKHIYQIVIFVLDIVDSLNRRITESCEWRLSRLNVVWEDPCSWKASRLYEQWLTRIRPARTERVTPLCSTIDPLCDCEGWLVGVVTDWTVPSVLLGFAVSPCWYTESVNKQLCPLWIKEHGNIIMLMWLVTKTFFL